MCRMKPLTQSVTEALRVGDKLNLIRPTYAYMDPKERVIYLSEGVVDAPREVFTEFLEFSAFSPDASIFTVKQLPGLRTGDAATFSSIAFFSDYECESAWNTLLKTGNLFDENSDWDWDCDGAVYVTEEHGVFCVLASAINGGPKMTPRRLFDIYNNMKKVS